MSGMEVSACLHECEWVCMRGACVRVSAWREEEEGGVVRGQQQGECWLRRLGRRKDRMRLAFLG